MRISAKPPPFKSGTTKAIRTDRSATESATATTTTSTTAPSSTFAWPSGNSYENKLNFQKPIPKRKHALTDNFPPPKALFARKDDKEETKATGDQSSSQRALSAVKTSDEISTATSATARILREAAQHCVKGQELMAEASTNRSPSSIQASVGEYQSALYILEQTIGNGFADRRECRSLLVMAQIFYWLGLAYKELASSRRETNSSKYSRIGSPSDTIDDAMELHERNAIQAFVSCLRLRYHLLDRGVEDSGEQKIENDEEELLSRFVSPVMDVQLVLTNLWETSTSPFCNMTVRESSRKLQQLRLATWNEDRGDEFMFAIADEKSKDNNDNNLHHQKGENLEKALAHYRNALESFSDENHKNDILRLKIASCYRQSGLRKLNTDKNNEGATRDFDAAIFWYRSALKAFCSTVRFAPISPIMTTATATLPLSPTQSQSPTPSVSSIDMSTTDSLGEEEGPRNSGSKKHEPRITKHPTYERILLRIEEILSWKQHQQRNQRQQQKHQAHKGGVSGTETSTIEQETTMRHYLRSKLKESISHQIQAESMLSPAAAWRRKPSKSLILPQGVRLEDEAASTMSSMSVLANALIMLRASVRIEEAVWGESHPIVLSLQETIDSTDEEYLDAEEQHADAADATQRVQKTNKKSSEYDAFHQHFEDLVEENKHLRTALDGSIENFTGASQNSLSVYEQKSGEPSNDKTVGASRFTKDTTPTNMRATRMSALSSDEAPKPVEFINVVPSQARINAPKTFSKPITNKFSSKPRGIQNHGLFPERASTETSLQGEEQVENMVHLMNRCRDLEAKLREADETILRLNSLNARSHQPQHGAKEREEQKLDNLRLEKRCREVENDLEESSKLREDLEKEREEQKLDILHLEKRCREVEKDLEVSSKLREDLVKEREEQELDNLRLEKRCREVENDLEESSKHRENLAKEIYSLEAKLEEQIRKKKFANIQEQKFKDENLLISKRLQLITSEVKKFHDKEASHLKLEEDYRALLEKSRKTETNLLSSNARCANLEQLRAKARDEGKAAPEADTGGILNRCIQAEADLERAKNRCTELESDIVKLKEEQLQSEGRETTIGQNKRIEIESKIVLDRYVKAEAELESSKKRCTELESDLKKRKEEAVLAKRENDFLRKKSSISLTPEQLEKSVPEESIPELESDRERSDDKLIEANNENDASRNDSDLSPSDEPLETLVPEENIPESKGDGEQNKLEEENNLLVVDLYKQLAEREKFTTDLREEVGRFEVELGTSKDECRKLQFQIDTMKETESSEDGIRIVQLENEMEQLSKEGGAAKAKLENECEELREKLNNEQNLSSVMAQEHELLVIGLKKDIEVALENKKEKERQLIELKKELEETKKMSRSAKIVLAASLYLEKDPQSATRENYVDEIERDDTESENNIEVSKRVNDIEIEALTNRIAELAKELELAEEKWKAEKDRLEKELMEKLENENNRVKELEIAVQTRKEDQERIEMNLRDMEAKAQSEETLSSRVVFLEAAEQELKEIIEAKERKIDETQRLKARILNLEKDLEDSKNNTADHIELFSRVVKLEKEKQATADELKEVTEMRDKEMNQTQGLQSRVRELETNLELAKMEASEQNDLREAISKLVAQVKEKNDEKEKLSSLFQSIESVHAKKDKEHEVVIARCTELEKLLEDAKKIESEKQDLRQIAVLEEKLELSSKKNDDIFLEMKSYETKLKSEEQLVEKTRDEHQGLLEKYNRLEKESHELQLKSDKNATEKEQRILKLIKAIDEIKEEKDTIALKSSNLEDDLKQSKGKNVELSTQLENLNALSQARKEDKERIEKLVVQLEEELKLANEKLKEKQDYPEDNNIERDENALAERIKELKGELETALEYNENLCSTVETYVEEKGQLQKKSVALETELRLANERIQKERGLLKISNVELEEEAALTEDGLMERIKELKEELKASLEYNENLCLTVETYIEEKEELHKKSVGLETDLKSANEKMQKDQDGQKDIVMLERDSIIELDNEAELTKDGMKKRMEEFKGELKTALEYNENLCSTVESYVKEKDELEKEIKSLRERNATETKALNENIERLESQLKSANENNSVEKDIFVEQISTLEKAMSTFEESNKNLTLEVESLDDKAKELQFALESSKAKTQNFVQQISALEKELESGHAKNNRIIAENESSTEERKELQLKQKQKTEERDNLVKQLAILEDALESATSKNTDYELKVELFEEERRNLEATAKRNAAERQGFIDSIAFLQKDFERISADNDTLSIKIASFGEVNEENEHLSSRVSSLDKMLKSSWDKNERLSEIIESLKESGVHQQRHRSRISELEGKVQSLQGENYQLSAEIEYLAAQSEDNERLKKQISDVAVELNWLQTTNQSQSAKIESLEGDEDENSRLAAQVSDLKSELDLSEATIRNLAAHIESLKENEQEHQRVINRLSKLEIELNSSEVTNKTLVTDNKSLQEQEEELFSRISVHESELALLRLSNQTLIDNTASLERQQTEHISRISDLVSQLKFSQEANLGLDGDLAALKEEESARINRISDLETELKASKEINQTLTADFESMEAQQEEYRLSMGQVAVLERELDNLNSINKSLTADIKSYESNRDDFDRMKNQVSSLEEEVEKVNIKSMSLQENIELKEKEIAAFVNQIAKLECDLDLSTRENHRFSEEKRSYDSSYDAINSNLKRTNEENRTLKARCEVHDKEIQDFKNEIARTNVKAEEDKKSLLQKNDVDRKENEYLSTRCLELENQVKESTEENREMASLLRQKTSQIKALNETIDEFEDLNQRAFEYDHVVNQCSELEEELLKTIEFNEELTGEMNSLKEEISTLNKRIFDAEVDQKEKAVELHTAQKSNRNLSRRRSSLAKELADVKDQFKMLSGKIAYPDSVEDGQEWTRLQLTELENRMEDVTQENELLENRMEDIMEENELLLSRLEEYKKTMKEQKNLEKSKNDQNLVKVCKELEEELLETVKMNDEVNNQVDALKKQIEDWKEYAENIEKELEDETEALQDTERKNADLLTAMDILDKHLQQVNIENKKIASQMLEAQNKTNERHADQFSELESNLEKAKKERDEAKSDVQSLTTSKKDLQILLEEAVQDIHELEESTEKLNAVILAKNELKRLLDKAELGRVEINQKYGQCKRDLQKAKEHLEEATAENTKLNRRLEIERNVSSAYKSEDENEFDDLYRKTREEMNDMEIMLEESRACVADLEENVQILQHQLQAALTFKLQQPKARTNRQFFGWRGGNRNQNKESKPAVVRDDDLEDGNEDDSADAF